MRCFRILSLLLFIIPQTAVAVPFEILQAENFPDLLGPWRTTGQTLCIETEVTRYFNLTELQLYSTRISCRLKNLKVSAGCRTFGWDLYRETGFGIKTAVNVSRDLTVRAGLSLFILNWTGTEKNIAFSLNGGCTIRFGENIAIRGDLYNINEPRCGSHSLNSLEMRVVSTFLWYPVRRFGLGLRLETLETGCTVNLSAALGLGPARIAVSTGFDPLSFSVAFSIRTGRTTAAIAWNTLRDIGEQRRTAALSLRIPLKKNTKSGKKQKININSRNSLRLASLPGMTPSKIRALAAYKKLYGPFRRTVDICRVRGINRKLYTAVAGKIAVNDRGAKTLPVREKAKTSFRINSAEIRDCVQSGFTPGEALQLIRFRNRLGGFITIREVRLIPVGNRKNIIRKLEKLYE